jgi:hypothetical protein
VQNVGKSQTGEQQQDCGLLGCTEDGKKQEAFVDDRLHRTETAENIANTEVATRQQVAACLALRCELNVFSREEPNA